MMVNGDWDPFYNFKTYPSVIFIYTQIQFNIVKLHDYQFSELHFLKPDSSDTRNLPLRSLDVCEAQGTA